VLDVADDVLLKQLVWDKVVNYVHKARVLNLSSEDTCTTLIQCVISLLAEGSEHDVCNSYFAGKNSWLLCFSFAFCWLGTEDHVFTVNIWDITFCSTLCLVPNSTVFYILLKCLLLLFFTKLHLTKTF